MANEQLTRRGTRPAPMALNDEGRGAASISISAQSIDARDDRRDTSIPTGLSRSPNAGILPNIPETSASGLRPAAAQPSTSAIPRGLSEPRTNLPAILRKNNGEFRTAMQYMLELERESFGKRDREAAALPDLGTRGTKRSREIDHPGSATGSTMRRQIGLGREIDTISASSPVDGGLRGAHSSNKQGTPESREYNGQPSTDRAQETSQGSSTLPGATSVSALYSGPLAEWFGRDTGYDTDRNSDDTISAPTRGLEELDATADSRYLGNEAQSLSVHVTTPLSDVEASSPGVEHTQILDETSSARSGELVSDADGGTILEFPDDPSPRAQRSSQTTRNDSPEWTDAALAEIDAVFESFSKTSLAGGSVALDLREPGSGGALQKDDVGGSVDGMRANRETHIVPGDRHSPQAPEFSGGEFHGSPEWTDAALAEIDAIIKSHSDRSSSMQNAAPELFGAGLNGLSQKVGVVEGTERMSDHSATPIRSSNVHSPTIQTSSQPSPEGFPNLGDVEWARLEQSARIAASAAEKGKQQISSRADPGPGLGNSSAAQVSHRSFAPTVHDDNPSTSSWFREAEMICNKLVENTYLTPTVYGSGTRNDIENTITKFGDVAPAQRQDNLGRAIMSTPVREVIPSASRERQQIAHATGHSEADDIQKRSDRHETRQPYMRGLDLRSREGYGR